MPVSVCGRGVCREQRRHALSIIRVRDRVVSVMRTNTEDWHSREGYTQEGAVEASVVEGGEAATDHKEEQTRDSVYPHNMM